MSPVEILRQLPAGEESILLEGTCLMSCSSSESESEKTWPGSSGKGRMQTINPCVIKHIDSRCPKSHTSVLNT